MSRPITTTTRNITLISSLAICQLVCAQSATVQVTDPRPVAQAVTRIEAIYGWPITYEDPITVNESRLEDVTERVRRVPEANHHVIVQKEVTLSFTYRLPSSLPSFGGESHQFQAETKEAVADVLSSVLKGYAASRGPEAFKVWEEGGMFHVVPTNFLGKEGRLKELTPILDTRITILPKQRTRQDLLHEICQSLTRATEVNVEAILPFSPRIMDAQTSISGSGVTARSLLIQLLAELATQIAEHTAVQGPDSEKAPQHMAVQGPTGSLSWRLLYGPGDGYALNVHRVTLRAE